MRAITKNRMRDSPTPAPPAALPSQPDSSGIPSLSRLHATQSAFRPAPHRKPTASGCNPSDGVKGRSTSIWQYSLTGTCAHIRQPAATHGLLVLVQEENGIPRCHQRARVARASFSRQGDAEPLSRICYRLSQFAVDTASSWAGLLYPGSCSEWAAMDSKENSLAAAAGAYGAMGHEHVANFPDIQFLPTASCR